MNVNKIINSKVVKINKILDINHYQIYQQSNKMLTSLYHREEISL